MSFRSQYLLFFFIIFIIFIICFSLFPLSSFSQPTNISCPLNFTILRPAFADWTWFIRRKTSLQCHTILQGLHLVLSDYLKHTGIFFPPLISSDSCWLSYKTLFPNFDFRSSCGFQTSYLSLGCLNLTKRSDFEAFIPNAALKDVVSHCNRSLKGSACASCTPRIAVLRALYLNDNSKVSDCMAYPFIYAAAVANYLGPTDVGVASCLFSIDLSDDSEGKSKKIDVIVGVMIVVAISLGVFIGGSWFVYRKYHDSRRKKRRDMVRNVELDRLIGFELESIRESTNLVKFTFEEVKKATRNFSRHNIIGRGGYGNVYRGYLPDGSEVAFKRFKNCSAAGNASFTHEVEVIASVRHVNLVALRGYCTATTPYEGHQRIIVCDLMKNGSLHDHLFGSAGQRLGWPIRQRIALGTARGLAYLHYGVQPAIIHRDIKASNILLDDMFEAKLADFGLAKFIPEGITHMSTRVAGTMGYVAPEYALYGQLTERSDVYSFGMVLLEILSGKSVIEVNENQPSLVADWAWSLVKSDRTLDVIEDGMPDMGPAEVMQKYVLIAILCSHPELLCRPTMDQVVNMLETDISIPSIPERPIPLVAPIDDIERSISNNSSVLRRKHHNFSPG